MNPSDEYEEYLAELRAQVCSRCVARLPGAPPCSPQGRICGIEQHLPEIVAICRTTDSVLIDPYIEKLHDLICANCDNKDQEGCPCPLDYLLQLTIEAVESVERRRASRRELGPSSLGPAEKAPIVA